MHWVYLIHAFYNLSWITEINELFHDILIYWDAPVFMDSQNKVLNVKTACHDVSAKEAFKCCVLGCTNEHRSLHRLPPSEPSILWLSFIVWGNVLEKIGNVPNTFRNQYQSFVRECQLQTVSRVCFINCPSERANCHSVRLMMLKLPLYLSVFTGAVFMNDHE